MSKTNPARGMRDFLPADVRKREYVIGIIKKVYESYGFEPLETPAVENIETLMGKYGEEGNQLIFKILKRGEKLVQSASFSSSDVRDESRTLNELSDLALRYDLTVPLARVVADRRNELPKFFKRYQIQPVWRADRPARGRFREFYQCDVDAIGSRSMVVEAELISAVSDILARLGFQDFLVRINHREVLRGMLDAVGVAEDKHSDALVALDKIDKIGADGVLKELSDREISGGDRLVELLNELAAGGGLSDIEKLSVFIGEHESGQAGVRELDTLLGLAGSPNVKIDASLARGLSYYTGTIIEINVPDLAGSLGGGGRYDGLIGMFGKEQIPACGFSLGLERILVVMDERGMFPPEIAESTPADVMVTLWSEDTAGESLKLASELRSQGLRVTVYPEPDKFGKQMKYADTIRVPYVCILGPDEIEKGVAKLKNMRTGEEFTAEPAKLAENIKQR
jgi:histidyl-tRNA synthetase